MKKLNQNAAITICFQHGIAITNSQFTSLVKEFNNWEMPINERVKRIAADQEPKFYEFIKDKV